MRNTPSQSSALSFPNSTPPPPRPRGMRGVWELVRTQSTLLGSAALTAIIASACGLLPFWGVYRTAQELLQSHPDPEAIWFFMWFGLGATLTKFFFMILSHGFAHAGAFRILYDLRIQLGSKFASVPLGFFQRHSTSSLQKAMTDDVGGLEAFLAHMLPDAAAAFSVPVFACLVLFTVDWRMALAAMVALPIAIFVQISMLTGANKAAYEEYHRVNETTKAAVLSYLRGIHVVRTFGIQAQSFQSLKQSIDDTTAYVENYARNSAPAMVGAMKLLGGGTNALFLVPVGVYFHQQGSLDTATFILFLLVGTQILSPFLRIANALGNLQLLLHGADHIQELLATPELPHFAKHLPITPVNIHNNTNQNASNTTGFEITLRNIDFSYDARDGQSENTEAIFTRLSCHIPAQKITAIVGPSGSGKSTILRLIARFWDIQRGHILVNQQDIRHLPLDDHLQRISMVFQDVFLFHGTVKENLRLAKEDATDVELIDACRHAHIHETIAALPEGYDTLLGERGSRLSGGEKQRLSIARAILKNAPILLLDEATAFADAENESLIHAAIQNLCRNKTVIVVAHRLHTIRHAHHIIMLSDGQQIDCGTHETLITRCAAYQKLWKNYEQAAHWGFNGS